MTFDEIKALSDGEAIHRVYALAPDVTGAVEWGLAGLLEEKLRERGEFSVTYGPAETSAGIRTTPRTFRRLYWPATTSPCRVRVDAFLVAFGDGK